MAIFDGIINSIAGPVVSGVFGALGQQSANESNQQLATQSNEFNAQQASLNRQFQSDQAEQNREYMTAMSGSSYQRAVGDLKAAGLNPMLAYQQGGASTPSSSAPSGSAASAVSPPRMGNVNAAGVAAAGQAAELQQALADTHKKETEATVNVARGLQIAQDTATSAATARKIDQEVDNLRYAFRYLLPEQVNTMKSGQGLNFARANLTDAERNFYLDSYANRLRALGYEADLSRYALAPAKAQAEYSERAGMLSPLLTDVAKGAGSAYAISRAMRGGGTGLVVNRNRTFNSNYSVDSDGVLK